MSMTRGRDVWHAVGSHGETRRRRVGQRSRPQERRKGSPQSPVAGHDRRQVRRRWMPVGCTMGGTLRRRCAAVAAHALAAATGSGMGNAHGAAALLDHEAVAGGTRHKANG